MALDEFAIIQHYFQKLVKQRPDVVVGIGDDAAIVRLAPGQRLVMAMDMLIAGTHFPLHTSSFDIGYKALAVNLSDLAAMGATPSWVMLGISLPQVDVAWLEGFCAGFAQLADLYNLQLIGGDTTRGALSITIQLSGYLPVGKGLLRSGAKPGDLVYVTGQLGDAGLALRHLQGTLALPESYQDAVLPRLNRPTPRVREGLLLLDLASAAIDISDGLVADLGHILNASQVGATLLLQNLPLSLALQNSVNEQQAWSLALTAGDDYELCFTIPAVKRNYFEQTIAKKFGVPCRCIGVIEEQSGLRLQAPSGELISLARSGYNHFT